MSKIKKVYIGEDRETLLFQFEDQTDGPRELNSDGVAYEPKARLPDFWTEVALPVDPGTLVVVDHKGQPV